MTDQLRESPYLDAAQRTDLIRRWSEPHREYHDLDHLRHVLTTLDELLSAGVAFDHEAAVLAAWFHDAIYEIAAPDNEERSALLAESMLAGRGIRLEVARLVRATAAHYVEDGDANAAALCDADLSILGSDASVYDEYRAKVRREYAAVPDELYRPGRADVLEQLLGLDALFHTEIGRARWEDRARKNLMREVAELRAG